MRRYKHSIWQSIWHLVDVKLMLATKSSPCWASAQVVSVRFILNYSRISLESSVPLSPSRNYFSEKFKPRADICRSSKKENLIETHSTDWSLVTSISGDNTPYTQHTHSMKKHESNHFPCSYILQRMTFRSWPHCGHDGASQRHGEVHRTC